MSVDLYINNVSKQIPEMTDIPEVVEIDNIKTVHHTITHSLPVSGTLDGGVTAIMGVVIPANVKAKITVSTDISYRGDALHVNQTDNALWVLVDQTFSGHRFYDDPVEFNVQYEDKTTIGVRVQLSHIESTSGNVSITVEYDLGTELSGIDNVIYPNSGLNLFNPAFIVNDTNVNPNGYLERVTSGLAIGYVPITAGGYVSFNQPVSKSAIVSKLYDGTFDASTEYFVDATKIENTSDSDRYVVFSATATVMATLMVVSGEYPSDYTEYNPIGAYTEEEPDRTYGTIGLYYPDESKNVKRIDSNQRPNRLRFVHISDTHQSSNDPIKCMGEFTDLSGAKFLTITGDMVNNSISNDFEKTKDQILAMTKPCYICMGNHDVWGDTAETQRYTKYFNPIATHNGLAQDVSYYAVDFTTEKVKCIWLDIYELSTDTPSFEMSATQINWFLAQLDDAITNSYHVCVFLHQPLTATVLPVNAFFDHSLLSAPVPNLKWILDTVKAFQDGASVEFTHNGNSFTHTFSGHGVFVAYFSGHTHWDEVGWCKDYNQFNVTINRFLTVGEQYDMTYRAEKLGIVGNYVAIDTSARRLSVVRVGNNNTICGIKRDAFTVLY